MSAIKRMSRTWKIRDIDDGNARDLAAQRKVREAARTMLAALRMIETCLRPDDTDVAARAVRAAIARAEAAGIKESQEPGAMNRKRHLSTLALLALLGGCAPIVWDAAKKSVR